jgi:threonine/homoserine/homoserine lactone efflux protein
MGSLLALITPLAAFALVSSITPGPNNLLLLSSGARFGVRRSVPHMLGITAGFLGLLAATYAGIGAVITAFPSSANLLAIVSALYLLWLAYQLLGETEAADKSDASAPITEQRQPWSWRQAAVFQLINPKAWGMAVAAASLVSGLKLDVLPSLLILLAVCGLVNLPCIWIWAAFGASLRRWLTRERPRQVFNAGMAVLLVCTALWMLYPLTHT